MNVEDTIYFITTPLSLLGELTILFTFIRYRQQLLIGGAVYVSFIFFQVLSTFLLSSKLLVTTLLSELIDLPTNQALNMTENEGRICISLAIVDQFSYAATVCWNFAITIQILYLLYKVGASTIGGFDFEENKKYWNVIAHTAVWTISGVSAMVPALLGQYGPSLNGCYITYGNELTMLIISVAPMCFFTLISFLVIFIAILFRTEFLRKQTYIHQVGTSQEISQFPNFGLLVGFTCIFLFHWFPYVTLRLIEQIDETQVKSTPYVVLSYIQMVSFSSQGISSAIVWWSSGVMDFPRTDADNEMENPSDPRGGKTASLMIQNQLYSYPDMTPSDDELRHKLLIN